MKRIFVGIFILLIIIAVFYWLGLKIEPEVPADAIKI